MIKPIVQKGVLRIMTGTGRGAVREKPSPCPRCGSGWSPNERREVPALVFCEKCEGFFAWDGLSMETFEARHFELFPPEARESVGAFMAEIVLKSRKAKS